MDGSYDIYGNMLKYIYLDKGDTDMEEEALLSTSDDDSNLEDQENKGIRGDGASLQISKKIKSHVKRSPLKIIFSSERKRGFSTKKFVSPVKILLTQKTLRFEDNEMMKDPFFTTKSLR